MPSTKRKIEIEITEAELNALRSVIYPTLPNKSAEAYKIAKHFLHRVNDSYYRDRVQKLRLPKLDEIIDL